MENLFSIIFHIPIKLSLNHINFANENEKREIHLFRINNFFYIQTFVSNVEFNWGIENPYEKSKLGFSLLLLVRRFRNEVVTTEG